MIIESGEFDLDNILDKENISPITLNNLKQCVFGEKNGLKKLDDKISIIEESIEKGDTDSYLLLGISRLAIGKIDEAIEALNEATAKKKVFFFMGKCYQEQGKYDKSIELFEQAESKSEDKCLVQSEIAVSKRRAGNAEDASQVIKSMLEEDDNNPELHYQYAHCLDDIGEKEDALKSYERALELDPDHPYALFRLAYNYDRLQREDEAAELYEQCNQLPVKYSNSFLNLGIVYEDKGEYDKAVACYETILKSDPNNLRAQMYIKDAQMSQDMYYDESCSKSQSADGDVLNVPISDFELSVRSRNCLEKMFINTLGDLTRVTEQDLLSYKNFGETSLYEIRNILKQKGLRLGQAVEKGQGNNNNLCDDII